MSVFETMPRGPAAFDLYRAVLAPLVAIDSDPSVLQARWNSALALSKKYGCEAFASFLVSQGLAGLWSVELPNAQAASDYGALASKLRDERFGAVARYLDQRAAVTELDRILTREGIVYAAFKGAWVREAVYADPALRAAGDIDVLVSSRQRHAAVQALRDSGYALWVDAENISHECSLTRRSSDIDLHWDILRPGRTRRPLIEDFLARRQCLAGLWGLSDTDVMFMMLVHPAFAKYVCASNTVSLIRVIDFVRWARARQVQWDDLINLLDASGLNTAAWAVLSWWKMLIGEDAWPVPRHVMVRLAPGRIRQSYLRAWIEHDLPTRLAASGIGVQIPFTLALHDRASDAAHAISGWMRSRVSARRDPLLRIDASKDSP